MGKIDETKVMARMVRELEALDVPARARVLRYVVERLSPLSGFTTTEKPEVLSGVKGQAT